MRINWTNIFGLLFLIFAVYAFFKMRPVFDNLLDVNNRVHYYGYEPGPIMLIKVLKLGLVCLTAVAIAKLVSRR